MKYEITNVTTTAVDVTYEDGAKATVPINGDDDIIAIKAKVNSWATKPVYSDVSKVPVTKGFQGTTDDDLATEGDPTVHTYATARAKHYPSRGDQWDALYWQRKGDASHLTKIDEAIADTKAKWPKTTPNMTTAEYNAKIKEIYG